MLISRMPLYAADIRRLLGVLSACSGGFSGQQWGMRVATSRPLARVFHEGERPGRGRGA